MIKTIKESRNSVFVQLVKEYSMKRIIILSLFLATQCNVSYGMQPNKDAYDQAHEALAEFQKACSTGNPDLIGQARQKIKQARNQFTWWQKWVAQATTEQKS